MQSNHSEAIRNRFEAMYIAAGMPSSDNWYWSANADVRQLASKHNIDFNVCAAVVAALSPRIRWRTKSGNAYPNLTAADRLITGYRHHERKADVFANVAGFNHNKVKAWAILRQNNIAPLSGPKVTAFYNNIVDPDNDDNITVDSWMIAVAYDLPLTEAKTKYAPSSIAEYNRVKQCLIDVAAQYGISAVELQAIVWQYAKKSSGHWRTM